MALKNMPKATLIGGLEDLKPIANKLKKSALFKAQETRARELREKADREKLEEEANLFRAEVRDVVPIRNINRARVSRPSPLPLPKQRLADEKAALRASLSDEIDIESLLDTDEALSFRQPGLGIEVVRKLRRGEWSIQAQLDLHGMRSDEARLALVGFLSESLSNNMRCLRVIHGKGLGSINKEPVLKGKVLKWLIQRDEVMAFCQARPNDGGSGALLILLRGATR
jgi:DNA-nicking Smr family endonuclease